MKENNFNQHSIKYPLVYEIFGIYVDWQIDNNLIAGLGKDPNGIDTFEDFLNKFAFRITESQINGKSILSIDIVLPKFSLLKMIGLEPVRILSEGISGTVVEESLAEVATEKGLECFDLLDYYMSKVPWDLTDSNVMNKIPEKLVIDKSFFDIGRIIIKVMTKEGIEKVTSANDIMNGDVDDFECLIDARRYDEDVCDEIEKYWSEKLGIPILVRDEVPDFNYKYPKI